MVTLDRYLPQAPLQVESSLNSNWYRIYIVEQGLHSTPRNAKALLRDKGFTKFVLTNQGIKCYY